MAGPLHQRGRSSNTYRPITEINVTPMVDVMLVLLIIFMVTMPLMVTGMKVNLPDSTSAKPLDQKEPITITVSKEGQLLIGQDEVTRFDLIPTLKTLLGPDPDRVIRLRGDKETSFGAIVQVLDELSLNGLTRVAIVTDKRDLSAPKTIGPAPNSQETMKPKP
jgi:biopolymer transport protein ExbD/biopolymer transport protein TolR